MKTLVVDDNGRTTLVCALGFSKDYTSGEEFDEEISGIVRLHAVDGEAKFRYKDDGSDGVVLGADETEKFFIEKGKTVEVLSGKINVMY